MFVRIQRGSPVPVSRQIELQIRGLILSGTLESAEQLPSVRQMARELAVNVNTVVRVYERLAGEGLVEMRHGEGTYVSSGRGAAVSAQLRKQRLEYRRELEALARRGLALGIPSAELLEMFSKTMDVAARDVVVAELSQDSSEASS